MAKRKSKGKIHPLFLQHVVHREDPPPSEILRLGSDHVGRLSSQRENTCLELVESQYSQPHACYEEMSYETTPLKPTSRIVTKKKEKRTGYNSSMKKKIETLGEKLNPIPLPPKKFLDLAAHKCLLTNLGLWEFFNLDFDKVIIPGLIQQLVANYNPKRRRGRSSFVNGYAIHVSPSTMASALRLPTKEREARKRKRLDQDYALESGVVRAVSEDDVSFVLNLVRRYLFLQDGECEVPDEVKKIVSDVRNRKIEKVDWSGLVWFMMKRELLKGTTLTNCYYASYMQLLIEYQKPWLIDSAGFPLLEMGSAEEEGGEDSFVALEYNFFDSFEEAGRMQIETVKTIDSALKKGPSLELSLVTAQEQEEVVVTKSQKCKDLMTSLFDEQESKELVVNEEAAACDANGGGVVDAIVLDSDEEEEEEEEEREHQLNCIDGRKGFVLQQPSLQQENACFSAETGGGQYLASAPLDSGGGGVVDFIVLESDEEEEREHRLYQANAYKNKLIEDLQNQLAFKNEVIEDLQKKLARYVTELHWMDDLVIGYKNYIKETDKRIRHCQPQQPVEVESLYMDHPEEKGKVITVAEWKKLVQERENKNKTPDP